MNLKCSLRIFAVSQERQTFNVTKYIVNHELVGGDWGREDAERRFGGVVSGRYEKFCFDAEDEDQWRLRIRH